LHLNSLGAILHRICNAKGWLLKTTAKTPDKPTAKTSTFPPLRVNEEVRTAAEAALVEGETLSGFVLESIQYNIQRRAMQQEFVARGLAARDEARRTGKYVSAEDVLASLDKTLARSRKAAARK
jgi:predicted transcriptional regulator